METYSAWVLNKVLQAKSLTLKLLVGNPTNCSQERKTEEASRDLPDAGRLYNCKRPPSKDWSECVRAVLHV